MEYYDIKLNHDELYNNLRIDCKNCFGFCCVALYFSTSDGFPTDKMAGNPCRNLQNNFQCKVHNKLSQLGLRGCTAYDCFGAGQKVAQYTYDGLNWRQAPEVAKQMFDVFLIMRQLHEMLWYLFEAWEIQTDKIIRDEIEHMIQKTDHLTTLNKELIIKIDIIKHKKAVNDLLKQTSELIRSKYLIQKKNVFKFSKTLDGYGLDLIGLDLRSKDLRGENLSGAYLIGADLRGVDLTGTVLIGADVRDTDLRGADITKSIFLTQSQINTAKGDATTKLPNKLKRPLNWL